MTSPYVILVLTLCVSVNISGGAPVSRGQLDDDKILDKRWYGFYKSLQRSKHGGISPSALAQNSEKSFHEALHPMLEERDVIPATSFRIDEPTVANLAEKTDQGREMEVRDYLPFLGVPMDVDSFGGGFGHMSNNPWENYGTGYNNYYYNDDDSDLFTGYYWDNGYYYPYPLYYDEHYYSQIKRRDETSPNESRDVHGISGKTMTKISHSGNNNIMAQINEFLSKGLKYISTRKDHITSDTETQSSERSEKGIQSHKITKNRSSRDFFVSIIGNSLGRITDEDDDEYMYTENYRNRNVMREYRNMLSSNENRRAQTKTHNTHPDKRFVYTVFHDPYPFYYDEKNWDNYDYYVYYYYFY